MISKLVTGRLLYQQRRTEDTNVHKCTGLHKINASSDLHAEMCLAL